MNKGIPRRVLEYRRDQLEAFQLGTLRGGQERVLRAGKPFVPLTGGEHVASGVFEAGSLGFHRHAGAGLKAQPGFEGIVTHAVHKIEQAFDRTGLDGGQEKGLSLTARRDEGGRKGGIDLNEIELKEGHREQQLLPVHGTEHQG